jgi:hypothetical protein
MRDDELIVTAVESAAAALAGLKQAVEIGCARPVPAQLFTTAMVQLRVAMSAATELESRARGSLPPKKGD